MRCSVQCQESPNLGACDTGAESTANALCCYPHVKVEIRDSTQICTPAPIFSGYNYFIQNIWGEYLVQFHFQ